MLKLIHTRTHICTYTGTEMEVVCDINSCRVIPDRWKGMSPEQVEKIRETQAIQREERKVTVE